MSSIEGGTPLDDNRFKTVAGLIANRRLSRREAVRQGGLGLAAAGLAAGLARRTTGAQEATPVANQQLAEQIAKIMSQPKYSDFTQWGTYALDLETGDVMCDQNSIQRYVPGSTTKLFPSAASLVAYGPNFTFETPVYRQGAVTDGALDGDLILVASGDITMGGRNLPDGTMAFSNIDHTDANAVPGFAELTSPDPLGGLDDLAEQVAAAGIKSAKDVIIDARLWTLMPKDDYVLSPIMINDNVVDVVLTPGAVGDPATIEWRPKTAYFEVSSEAKTVATDQSPQVAITSPAPHQILVQGQVPAGIKPLVQTFQVEDPAEFARALFVEALARKGVTIAAPVVGPNPDDRLPAADAYQEADRVALFRSFPFSATIKGIL
jgi:D-alanyl-D-alanine carboxypeptidase/D-alanyl-D-alanine-endopeptidase (penicillin-binding protein 4)